MKVLRFTFFFIVAHLIGQDCLQAQSNLRVLDPQFWYSSPGSIDEASFVIKPKGIYMEVSMYLTFSAQDAPYAPDDTLEVILDFELPEDAIVHDSWLWIEDEIIKADIIDRWTATGIYEEIVNRRQDPSILYKQSATWYQLRIFPMAAHSSRKVKVSYLAPTTWQWEEVLVQLPYDILAASHIPLDEVEVTVYLDPEWTEPKIKEAETETFQLVNNPELGPHYYMTLPFSEIQNSFTFSVKSPLQDGFYVNQFEASNIYQLAISPAEVFDLGAYNDSKIAFVLSHHPENSFSHFNQTHILEQLRQTMFDELSEGDAFNLFFDDDPNDTGLSQEWLPFNWENVSTHFEDLIQNGYEEEGSLFETIFNAVEFIKNNGGDGDVVVISNSQNEGWLLDANPMIEEILDLIGDDPIPIHIIDYQSRNFWYFWWDEGSQWRGNEYFYDNISRLTGGNYVRDNFFPLNLRNLVHQFTTLEGTLDLYTTLEEGFTYQRFNLGPANDLVNLNDPILQVGKYQGNFPLRVFINAFYENNVFSEEIVLSENQVHFADTLSEEIWAGQYIRSLEANSNLSNSSITNIIERSIEERVLSKYTAFLCLEPSLGGEPCIGCIDETGGDIVLTDVKDVKKEPWTVTAYPNPFSKTIQLQLEIDEMVSLDDYRFVIYNALGQVVKVFNMAKEAYQGLLEITWDAEAEQVPGGIYYFEVTNGNTRQVLKLVYLK